MRQSEQTAIPLVRLRKLVIFDRLLARLVVVAPERWILKGAVALHYRVGPTFRTTRDLDLGRLDDEQAATADFREARTVDLGDYFVFSIQRTTELAAPRGGAAVRYHLTAHVDGRPFEDVTIDVGFGDPPAGPPDILRGPDLLSFAEIPPAEVPTVPLEQHVAEKLHAYTRTYAGGQVSTRVKDLIDLLLIGTLFPFQASRLRTALRATFSARGSQQLPSMLPMPPPEWQVPFRRMATEVGVDPELSVGYEQARSFLDPLLDGSVPDDARWDPAFQRW
ncbi:MAG: nucleotidyl transferase AbiEii/AbiGii toxin family protein [Chloroflexota bacterium]